MASSCNKPYKVTSSNPKMSGAAAPIKSYQNGGLVTAKRDPVQDTVDAIKRFQNASEKRYKEAKMGSSFLPVYEERANRARQDMKAKAAIAKRDYAFKGLMSNLQDAVKPKTVDMPRKTAAQHMMSNMPEDPRKPGAFMRNARRDIESAPKYTEKERTAMREVEGRNMTKKMQDAYKRFYGK